MDKSAALWERGVEADWPEFGLPDRIQTDNGSDFKGQTFVRAAPTSGSSFIFAQSVLPATVGISNVLSARLRQKFIFCLSGVSVNGPDLRY